MYSLEMQNLIDQDKLTIVDDNLITIIKEAYNKWKDLNKIIEGYGNRRVNFPSCISESIICYTLGFLWSNKGEVGDAYTPNGKMVEIKATSDFNKDTTSFSPIHPFDLLIFGRLNYDEDILYIYDLKLDSNKIKTVKVNKTQTFGEQQKQGRRPRFCVIKQIIEDEKIEPIATYNFKTDEIIKY